MTHKPILCVDFDGVIHSYESGWHGDESAFDSPVPGAMKFLKNATEVFKVCIYSSRSKTEIGRIIMKAYIRFWAIKEFSLGGCQFLNDLEFSAEKPSAFLTIDDRCFKFEGIFPKPGELLSYKPWNKK